MSINEIASVLDEQGLRFFTFEEMKGVGLHGLMLEAQRIGFNDRDLMTAPPAALAGVLYAAQMYDPTVVPSLEEYLQNLAVKRKDRAIVSGGSEKKPRERSKVGGAVARVHEICNKHPNADRKEVIKLCVEAGINENTAKTQYAAWKRDKGTGAGSK